MTATPDRPATTPEGAGLAEALRYFRDCSWESISRRDLIERLEYLRREHIAARLSERTVGAGEVALSEDNGMRYFLGSVEVTQQQVVEWERQRRAEVIQGGSGVVPEHLRQPGEAPEQYLVPWILLSDRALPTAGRVVEVEQGKWHRRGPDDGFHVGYHQWVDHAAYTAMTRALGYGDDINEPAATPAQLLPHLERQAAEANDWQESQEWRIECALAGHPEDADCREHDPALRVERVAEQVEALAEEFDSNVDWSSGRNNYGDNEAWESAARQARALADAILADGSAES